MQTTFHHIATEMDRKFSYLAYADHDEIELKLDFMSVRFNIQTAEQIADILHNYVEDYRREQQEYLRNA